jgi:hypothetical protein
MPKIFIDTQIYLNFYRTNVDIFKLFEEINKKRHYLIITEQIKDEFIRNRDTKIRELQKYIKNSKIDENLSSFGIFRKDPEFKGYTNLVKQIQQIREKMIKKCEEMLWDPKKDEIFIFFMKLYEDPNVLKIIRTDSIIKKAVNRKYLGNPPISKDKITIGDEINWESILEKVNDDLIIISDDFTFKDNFTYLFQEFQAQKHKKILGVFKEISKASPLLKEKPSKELKEFEKEQEQYNRQEIAKYLLNLRQFLIPTSNWATDPSGNININDSIFQKFSNDFSILNESTKQKIFKDFLDSEEKK